jgi:hypothetical protein
MFRGIRFNVGIEENTMDEKMDLIPAWFAKRMTDDVWSFGLLMQDGRLSAFKLLNPSKKPQMGASGSMCV